MELRHLRYFLAVARHRNFTRAAEELHIAQPPLSQQIQQLERELGATLFDRSARQVELTQAGEVLLLRARRVLEMIDDMTNEVREVAGARGGRVTLGVNRTAAALILPAVARLMRERMPGVELVILEGGTSTIAELVVERRVDLGLARLPLAEHEPFTALLESRPLYQEQVVAVLLRGHPLARRDSIHIAELRDEPLMIVRRDQGTLYEQIISACEAAGFTPRLVCEGAEIYTLVRLVEAGLGITLIPERGLQLIPGVEERVVGLPLRTGPDNEGIIMEAGLIWRRGRYRSQATLTLAEIIQEVAEQASVLMNTLESG
jgi:DNA-binding transcriptional LysR family regulator